jgi:hypothetical protein
MTSCRPIVARVLVTAAMLTTSAAAARAQQPPASRVVASLDVLAQLTTSTVEQTVTFEQFSEDGRLTTSDVVPRRPVIGGGLAVRLWKDVGFAVTAEHMSATGSTEVTALLPDPFTFNQPHTLTGLAGVGRTETAVHVDAAFWPYRSGRWEVLVAGGPSWIRVHQDFVADVSYAQPPPYTAVTYEGATIVGERRTVLGGNLAGDLTWRLSRHIGAGAVVRFSRAHALFADTGAPALVVGGLHAGVGLRVSF